MGAHLTLHERQLKAIVKALAESGIITGGCEDLIDDDRTHRVNQALHNLYDDNQVPITHVFDVADPNTYPKPHVAELVDDVTSSIDKVATDLGMKMDSLESTLSQKLDTLANFVASASADVGLVGVEKAINTAADRIVDAITTTDPASAIPPEERVVKTADRVVEALRRKPELMSEVMRRLRELRDPDAD